VYHTNSGIFSNHRCRFPVTCQFGKETIPRRAVLSQQLVSLVTI
ncbi:uncharacterized protein METZ01_LOCUS356715, partial [marine metagenome]